MSLSALSRRLIPALLLLALALPARLAADLVWTPQTGWKAEGGILTGLAGPDGRSALDLMNIAREEEESGKINSARKDYEKVGKKYSNSVYAPEAMYRAGKLQLERKKYSKSFDNFQTVVSRYPNTSRFDEIIGEQYNIGASLLNGTRGHFLWIFPGFTNREKGIQYMETLLINAPYSNYAPLALMNIAAGHRYLGNTEEAIYALDRLINNYTNHSLTPEAYIKIAESYASLVDGPYYDQAATKEAITYYEDFMILYPGDSHVTDAEKGLSDMKRTLAESKIQIADFYFKKRSNYKAARVFYNEAITVYPDSATATLARQRLAEVEAAAAKAAEPPSKKHKRFILF